MVYKLIRSKRKTISLEIDKEGQPLVRAPLRMGKKDIERFVESHLGWIQKHQEKFKNQTHPVYCDEDIPLLLEKAKKILPPLVEKYSKIMELYPEKVTVTAAKTRFGSCSGKNRICFSCFLMLYPIEGIEYVVVHELAHLRFHHHQKEFYGLVSQILPDYRERIKLLKG